MLPELDLIKKTRSRLGMTQKELAKKSSISPSMLNQIERKGAQPSYATAKKIFEILETEENKVRLKAGDICTRNIITLSPTNTVGDAVKLLSSKKISQIPIMNRNTCVGLITSDDITSQLGKNLFDIKTRLGKIESSQPPVVSIDSPAISLRSHLSYSKCILVSDKGKIVGIITSEDFHKLLD
jgi:predicted transcriptional regulator